MMVKSIFQYRIFQKELSLQHLYQEIHKIDSYLSSLSQQFALIEGGI
jgi:hypothetical protein